MWPLGEAIFGPGELFEQLGSGPLDDAKYQGFGPCSFRQEDFKGFILKIYF